MMNFLNNMSVKARLYLAVSMFLLTLVIALAQAYFAIGASIDFAAKEKMGNAVQRPVALMLKEASILRASLPLIKMGRLSLNETERYLPLISEQMGQLKAAEDLYGEALEFTDDGLGSRGRSHLKFETVQEKWKALSLNLKDSPTAMKTQEGLVSFIADLRGIIAHSGDTSNLILDPDLDSYYLMDVTLLAMPQTIDRLGGIAESMSPKLGLIEDGYYDKDIVTDAAVMSKMLSESDLDRVVADMDTSFNEDKNFYDVSPGYKEQYTPYLEAYKTASNAVIQDLDTIRSGKNVTLDVFSQHISEALDASGAFISNGFDQLDTLLDLRIADYEDQQIQILLISFIGVAVSMAFYVMVSLSISTPLANLKQVMMTLSNQDYNVDIPYTTARSEIGQMAQTVEVFKKNGQETLALREEQKEAELRAEKERHALMEQLASDFELQVGDAIRKLSMSSTELSSTAKQLEANTDRTKDSSVSVQRASDETSANVSTVASATEEMTASAQEISAQITGVAAKTSATTDSAAQTSKKVDELRDMINNIGEIVVAIKDIAEQTNLLALNATIEAARAGDAGKGFAVVADEVKSLANETATKTEEIERRISDIQKATEEAVFAMNEIIQNVSDINEAASGTSSAVEEQNSVIQEITRSITEVSEAVNNVSGSIEIVRQAAEDSEGSSRLLVDVSQSVSQLSNGLKEAVDQFLAGIRKK